MPSEKDIDATGVAGTRSLSEGVYCLWAGGREPHRACKKEELCVPRAWQ